MIFLISGASHTGKTFLSQKLMERYKYPYLSIDHIKMGLIRSGQTSLTALEDDKLVNYLWPIVREIIKTAIENKQNLIVEGCYIPFDYKKDFAIQYLKSIKYCCLVYSKSYIESNYNIIMKNSSVIETRLDNNYSKELMIADNKDAINKCREFKCNYILIDKEYSIENIQVAFENQL